jgi:type IV secretion system protein VirD4
VGAGWATPRELRALACPRDDPGPAPPGRLVLGWVGRRLVAAEARQSVIVFGPSQSRKTSGFAVPAILGWEGPVVATSVKADLVGDTIAHRRRCGKVWCFDPTGSTGLPSAGWSPLDSAATWPGARRAAAALTETARAQAGPVADGDFWYATATKLLAPLLLAAATGGRRMADVVRWVDTGEEAEVLDLLAAAGVREAVDAVLAAFGKEERQRSSTATTLETVLEPFVDLPVEAGHGPAVDPAALVAGSHTLYLCAPAHDQRRLSPLFTAVVRQVLEHVYDTVTRTGLPLDPPLLVVLDEAANVAPLPDLDALAATAAGHGVQLVSVWHDLAQITARYGPRAPTVVNNHRAKVFLSGISDPSTLDHASALIGEEEVLLPAYTSGGPGGRSTTRSTTQRRLAPPDALRRIPPGEGVLVYGGLSPARLRLRTWTEEPELAARTRGGEGEGKGEGEALRPRWRRTSPATVRASSGRG